MGNQEQLRNKEENFKLRVINKLKDGTIRESMKDYEVPYNDTTDIAYQLLTQYSE